MGVFTSPWGITVRDEASALSEASPATVTGLSNDHTYTCTVSAITGLGLGPVSNAVSVTPFDPNIIFSDGFEDV